MASWQSHGFGAEGIQARDPTPPKPRHSQAFIFPWWISRLGTKESPHLDLRHPRMNGPSNPDYKWGRGSLVAKSRFRGWRDPGSRPDSTEKPITHMGPLRAKS
ncbi:hypothetical protein AVEN_58111-1 [Araneus ventricosus]|uniref:Uncharacterized protein n=1 Tax=Araneus ventricosus TaxID=182803 RepID=A0A4Y2L0X5_ARAVE|nr:hypothetical protein AVEN_58111-1 [Araneus ventricosus]